jgi:hypothetical protein
MVPSIFGALSMELRVLDARGSCRGEQAIIGAVVPASFARGLTPPTAALSRLRKLHEAGHLAKTADIREARVARAIEEALVEQ